MSDEMPSDVADRFESELEEAAMTILMDTTFDVMTKDGRFEMKLLDATVIIPEWTWEWWKKVDS